MGDLRKKFKLKVVLLFKFVLFLCFVFFAFFGITTTGHFFFLTLFHLLTINFCFCFIHSIDKFLFTIFSHFWLYFFVLLCLHFLHLFGHFVRVKNTRNSYLDFTFFFLSFFESSFTFIQKQIGVIFASILSNLDQKVPQMFFKGWDVLIEVEKASYCDFDLVIT